jgi:hypothetical protein
MQRLPGVSLNRVLGLCLILLLASCSQAKREAGAPIVEAPAAGAKAARNYLAYEHTLSIEAAEQNVVPIVDAALAACRQAAADECTALESTLSSGSSRQATLKFRAKPAGIRALKALLSKQGEVAAQSTNAEDLAGPIEDGARKIAMLQNYRAKLEALLARANIEVDPLIKLNRELAEVQSQLEALNGTQAHLVRRVDTEILRVSISAEHHRAFWAPVSAALSRFGENLSEGFSGMITGMAYLIPWGLVLGVLVFGVRKLRRRWRLKKPV